MHIYVDETKQRDYLLVASVHVSTDLAALRQMVRSLLLPGQRYLHMKDEKDGRKRTIERTRKTAANARSPRPSSMPACKPPSTAQVLNTATNANDGQPAYKPSSKTTPPSARHASSSTRTKPW
ncbi:hypothetical protein [Mycolicibacterium monacense]|uniref:hypothetical protein n=1 Tax=Mycolicibacterium monacense TaxID=85693 RepID=UPI0022EC93CF|nr:hypothetical protein [Mycolicibacterium monacense]